MDNILLTIGLSVAGILLLATAVRHFIRGRLLFGIVRTVTSLCVLGLAIALLPKPREQPGQREDSRPAACQLNLLKIGLALDEYRDRTQQGYPTNLNLLSPSNVCPLMFVCPDSGQKPGSMSNVMEWTDYVYARGHIPGITGEVCVLICPPINHGGEGGCLLDANHTTAWHPRKEIDNYIDSICAEGSGLTVAVGKTLDKRSSGRFSKPTK